MKNILLIISLLIALPAAAADPVGEVRRAEVAFAKAFADRDQTKFFSFVLDDASFLGGLRTLAGKGQVVDRWSKFFGSSPAPFSWTPERVSVNGAGTIGLSTGPVYGADGKQIGNYASIWVKQPDGLWKILFDGPGSQPACLPGDQAPYEEGFLPAADGTKLHYRKIGNGPVTLIVPLDFILFDDFKQLADLATVIAYDMRNRGRSERSKNVSIQQDVADMEAVRSHFKIEKFVPIGFSYLGLMVAMYALDHSEHVSRMVQLGPVSPRFDTQYPKELANGTDDVAAPEADVKRWREMRAQGMAQKSPREFCEAWDKVFRFVLIGDPAHASRIQSHCDLENEWPANLDATMESSMESLKKVEITKDQMKKITMPVLIIHGTKDRNAPYGSGREWSMSLPNARLITIEGAAHASWVDDPATVFASIRQFLRGEWPLAVNR
ncbi:MAG: alpha/beta fold hydrolase [Acidobacteriota bacterium]|nr:alpha/beta fold hydrolase [Acidobacteriota bacterium]